MPLTIQEQSTSAVHDIQGRGNRFFPKQGVLRRAQSRLYEPSGAVRETAEAIKDAAVSSVVVGYHAGGGWVDTGKGFNPVGAAAKVTASITAVAAGAMGTALATLAGSAYGACEVGNAITYKLGRKPDDRKRILDAIKNNFSKQDYNACKNPLQDLKNHIKLSVEDVSLLLKTLAEDNRIEKIARYIGAKDDNLAETKTFIVGFLEKNATTYKLPKEGEGQADQYGEKRAELEDAYDNLR